MNKPKAASTDPSPTLCLCSLLRRASRAVTRAYDADIRATGLRVTQYSLLSLLSRQGEVRQGDLSSLTYLEETSLTRALRVLEENGWVALRPGQDRREKLVSITKTGKAKLEQTRPVWLKAQERMKRAMPAEAWATLFEILPSVAKTASDL